MPFLVIDGTTVEVQQEGFTERIVDGGADVQRASDGTLLASLMWVAEKREWSFNTPPLSRAALDGLVTLCKWPRTVPVTGDAVANATVNAKVHVEEREFIAVGLGFVLAATVTVFEV